MNFVFVVIAGLTTLLDTTGNRLRELRSEDRGSVSVEQVVITVVVLAVAIAVGAAITAAVTGRLGSIT